MKDRRLSEAALNTSLKDLKSIIPCKRALHNKALQLTAR
jgi:hypothetical protein